MKSFVECPHCGSRRFTGKITYLSGYREYPYRALVIYVVVSIFIIAGGLLLCILSFALDVAQANPGVLWPVLAMTLLGFFLLLAVGVTASNRKGKYVCQVCGTIWYVPLAARRTLNLGAQEIENSAEESLKEGMPDTGDTDLEQPPSPFVVNDLINALQDSNAATRRMAASRLRNLLPALDTMPATRAGVERALAEYERQH